MAKSKFYNLDTDTTLGGNNASDIYIASQKAVKSYVDLADSGKADVDLANINASASAKNTINSWGIPDYSAAITGITSPYTCVNDTYMIFLSDSGPILTLTVDGVQVFYAGSYSGNVWFLPYRFKKGSIITFTISPYFVCPLLGG